MRSSSREENAALAHHLGCCLGFTLSRTPIFLEQLSAICCVSGLFLRQPDERVTSLNVEARHSAALCIPVPVARPSHTVLTTPSFPLVAGHLQVPDYLCFL